MIRWSASRPLTSALDSAFFKQFEKNLGGLLWPSALRDFEHFRLRLATDTAVEAFEWNDFFLVDHVLQVTVRSAKRHASESVRCLTGILEVHT